MVVFQDAAPGAGRRDGRPRHLGLVGAGVPVLDGVEVVVTGPPADATAVLTALARVVDVLHTDAPAPGRVPGDVRVRALVRLRADLVAGVA